jgi:ATP-binding cassette, subfamily B, bacterial
LRRLHSQAIVAENDTQAHLLEILSGAETIKAMGFERVAFQDWSALFSKSQRAAADQATLSATVDSLGGALRFVAPLLVLALAANHVLGGTLSVGEMFSSAALAANFLGPMASLVATVGQLHTVETYVRRIQDVLHTPPERKPGRKTLVRATGRIALRAVSFAYDRNAPEVLNDVSLDIAPGAFVAIVGPSGSGKSTIVALLVGLYVPTRGEIALDGVSLREIDPTSFRNKLGVVTQQAKLFSGTIASNIAMGARDIPRSAIQRAATLACIHDEIAALPMGYDTPIVDGGASFSGGQRQRIALARALAPSPDILLLDEATSAMDAITEARIAKNLREIRATRILVAHRFSSVRAADYTYVLDNGRVVQQGRHEDLVRAPGLYYSLVSAQT